MLNREQMLCLKDSIVALYQQTERFFSFPIQAFRYAENANWGPNYRTLLSTSTVFQKNNAGENVFCYAISVSVKFTLNDEAHSRKIQINLSIDLTQWWHWHLLQQNKSNVNKTAFFVTSKMDTTT